MTEGSLVQHDKPMCVRIWLEVGHTCEPCQSAYGRALALDWRVWVRGVCGQDISTFVHKVVFYLHPSTAFVYPKRVLQEPPYEIQESGCASIEIPIHVYLKHSTEPKKIRLKYRLRIENNSKSSSDSRCIYYDLKSPSEQLWRSLMKGGAEVIARASSLATRTEQLLVVLSENEKPHKQKHARVMNTKKYKFIKPLKCKHGSKKEIKSYILEEHCSKFDANVDFKKLLRSMAMTDDEIKCVSQLYLSLSSYEKSAEALVLPPLSDPIYRVPELPWSLREALTIEADYTVQ